MSLIAAAIERYLYRRDWFGIRRGLGQRHRSAALRIEYIAMHLNVGGQYAGCGNLLTREFGEIADIELRCVQLQLDGVGLREGPLAQLDAAIQSHAPLRGRFKFRMLKPYL